LSSSALYWMTIVTINKKNPGVGLDEIGLWILIRWPHLALGQNSFHVVSPFRWTMVRFRLRLPIVDYDMALLGWFYLK
jgi:hypothetical protein